MQGGFQRSMPRILAHEGGKVDDRADPGGRTNQGVTQAVYSAYRRRVGLAPRDVYDMRPEERDAIYKDQYWNAVRGDDLPAGLDYVVFDGAVNSGPSRSVKWLQKALGVAQDGQVGSITIAAAQDANVPQTIDEVCNIRLAFLKQLRHWPRFGRGWSSRVEGVRKVGKAWANKEPVSVAPATPTPKAKEPIASGWSWVDVLLSPFRKA